LVAVKNEVSAVMQLQQQRFVVLFNIDRSGSMSSHWRTVCTAIQEFLKHLTNEDLVCGIVFNNKVEIITKKIEKKNFKK